MVSSDGFSALGGAVELTKYTHQVHCNTYVFTYKIVIIHIHKDALEYIHIKHLMFISTYTWDYLTKVIQNTGVTKTQHEL